jgi:hypothetical protein
VENLDCLFHSLLLELGEQSGQVRAGDGQACQYTVPMAGNTKLKSGGVRKGSSCLGVEARDQELEVVEARDQTRARGLNVEQGEVDVVARD